MTGGQEGLGAAGTRVDALEREVLELREQVERLGGPHGPSTHELRLATTRAEAVVRQASRAADSVAGGVERAEAGVAALGGSVARLEREVAALRTELAALVEAQATHARRLEGLERGDAGEGSAVEGALDVVDGEIVTAGPTAIRGWALATRVPLARVEVTVDGDRAEDVRVGLPRPDVRDRSSSVEAPISGFECFVDLSDRAGGDVVVEAQAVALDGARARIGRARAVAAPAVESRDDEARALELRGRSNARPRPSAPAGDELNLLVFAHSLDYGGAELRMVHLVRELARAGDFSAVVISPRDGPLRDELEALGVPVHITYGFGVASVDAYEGKQQELAAWLQGRDVNVALAVTLASFPGVDLADRLGVPCVWSVHETFPLGLFLRFGFPYESAVHPYAASRAEAAFATASAVLFQADASRRLYERYGERTRFCVVPRGIDLEAIDDHRRHVGRADARASLGLREGERVVLSVGVIQSKKGQTLLAKALREVLRRHDSAVGVILGDRGGSYAEALHAYVARAGLAERVRVLRATRDVRDWLAVADLFVNASFEETLGGAILEAMAYELPVVATDVGGVGELVEDGVTGFLCQPSNLAALIDGIERGLGATGEQVRDITERARARVRERYDGRIGAARFGRLLRALAEDPLALPHSVLAPDAVGTPIAGP